MMQRFTLQYTRVAGICGVLTLLVTACVTMEQEPPPPTPVAVDPAIYAIGGALTQNDALARKSLELQENGFSAVPGEGVSTYQDRQESRLRSALGGTDIEIFRIEDNLHIRIPTRAIFYLDGSDIEPPAFSILEAISTVLNEFDRTVVEISGHTDGVELPAYNRELSSRRIGSIVAFLAARNFDSNRVIEVPAGSAFPVGNDSTVAGRELNRRIEITLIPVRS
jgi:outer membrane protein OmpA-like peptidoglycan-associated protein